jgi:antitoxin VapB
MGQLNIKDAALIAEAKQLAELRKVSTTAAIREAVKDALARERLAHDQAQQQRFDALMEIGRRVRASLPPGVTSDHSYFYDENGLPK